MIRLDIIGVPAPQGSKNVTRTGHMYEAGGKNLTEWRRAVADAARAYLKDNPRSPIAEPIAVRAWFTFPASVSDPYRELHVSTPDASKVLRSTEDALVHGGLLKDDRYISDIEVHKRWCDYGETAGALVLIDLRGEVEAARREARKQRAAKRRKAAKAAS